MSLRINRTQRLGVSISRDWAKPYSFASRAYNGGWDWMLAGFGVCLCCWTERV